MSITTDTFTAIDFETACHDRASICQIGLVRVEAGEIVNELDLLVQPPGNWYHPLFPPIHGIDAHTTAQARPYAHAWEVIKPFIEGQTLVAHNMSFDRSCLVAASRRFALPLPEFTTACTLRIYRKALNIVCAAHNIPLKHHDALSDARACAQLFLNHLCTTPQPDEDTT